MLFRKLEVLSRSEMDRILDTSYRILETVGVRFEEMGALDRLSALGCPVARGSRIVHVPRRIAEAALAGTPKLMECSDTPKSFFCVWTGMNLVDWETKAKRRGTAADTKKVIQLTNHLENLTIASAGVLPQDVPLAVSDLVAGELLLKYSQKIFHIWNYTYETAAALIEMAKVVTGGEEELRDSKILSYMAEPVSPLKFSSHTCRIMELYAKYDLPITIGPMVQVGSTGPATLAGSLALQMAENLAGLVFVHSLGSGSPVALGGGMHVMDMRTGKCLFGAPEIAILHLAVIQLSHYLGYPIGTTSGLCDSNTPDFQNGWERGVSGILVWAAGAETIGMHGVVGSDEAFSLEQLVLDNEKDGMLQRLAEGMAVNEETLAQETIAKVGIGGHFLAEEHTRRHLRDYWQPKLFSRSSFQEWLRQGKSLEERAHERVVEILSSTELEIQIDEDQAAELERIREARVREIAQS